MDQSQAPQQRQLNPNDPTDALNILFKAASVTKFDMAENTLVRLSHKTLHDILNAKASPPPEPEEDGPGFGEDEGPGLGGETEEPEEPEEALDEEEEVLEVPE